MCLGIPGKIEEITLDDRVSRVGKVNFGNVKKSINLTFVPEAVANDFILAHVGVAIAIVDEKEASKTLSMLDVPISDTSRDI